MSRIEKRFAALREAGRAGLVTFITAGDPDHETCLSLLKALPKSGADIIELGMPFSDPMADGPAIQESSIRALKNGANLKKTLDLVREFRKEDQETPLILMGYYNPIFSYGDQAFAKDAKEAGIDGAILVDLPPEESHDLVSAFHDAGLDFIVLATPTTDDKRLPAVLSNASGFVYYVSVAGTTGAASAKNEAVLNAITRIRQQTSLPVAVGFGIKTPEQVRDIGAIADAAVVGSAIVLTIAAHLDEKGQALPDLVTETTKFVAGLAQGLERR